MTAAGIPTRDIVAKTPLNYNRIAGRALERLSALSDGLFAIAMTIIVLEIHVPAPATVHTEAALWAAITALGPRLSTYFLSFLTLGIFWVGQQTQLSQLARADRHFTWLHLAFLAFVAIMPFSTALLAAFTTFRVALLLYWANITLMGAMLGFSWVYAQRHALVKDDVSPEVGRVLRKRLLAAEALYAFGALLCFVNTYWSMGFIVLVQLYYAVAPPIRGLSRLTA